MRFDVAVVLLVVGAGSACRKDQRESPAPGRVPKLQPLARESVDAADPEAAFRVAPFQAAGPSSPADALTVEVDGERATASHKRFDPQELSGRPARLVFTPETYLAQVAGTLAALDDAGAEVWLGHPESPLAFRVTLRDEPAFETWLDETSETGKLRVIHRADGFELQTSMGKLPGPDPNGPSVPVRGGQADFGTLMKGLEKIRSRFRTAREYCVVPSFGMPMADVVKGLAANWVSADSPIYAETCLVYPRPGPRRDSGH